MVFHTRRMNGSGTSAWNRSLIELTNTNRGFRHRRGMSRLASSQTTLPVQAGPSAAGWVRLRYLAWPMAARRAAMRMA